MRHAYLVLAHQDPAALSRLLAALRHENVHFYIHVDDRGDDALVHVAQAQRDVTLVPRRQIRYKAWSMVEATLSLARAALADEHDRYSLISGSDYPIVTNQEICAFLQSADLEYLTFWRLADRPSWQHKLQYHYPVEFISIRDPRSSLPRRVFWAAFRRLRRFAPKRRHPEGLVPYGGSQWWTLTHACLEHALGVLDARPDVRRFYRTTESPDELIFQTIVMNGPFARRVCGYDAYQRWRAKSNPEVRVSIKEEKRRMLPDHEMNLRYIDWSGELTGAREAPAVLDERDLVAVTTSGCLWARKFDSIRSAGLLDEIDRRRHSSAS